MSEIQLHMPIRVMAEEGWSKNASWKERNGVQLIDPSHQLKRI